MCLKYTSSLSLTCPYPIFISASTENSKVFSCSSFCSTSCSFRTVLASPFHRLFPRWLAVQVPFSPTQWEGRNQIYKIKIYPMQQPGLSMLSPGSVYLFFVSSFYLLHLSSHISNLHLIQVLHPFIFLALLFPWTVFLWWVAVVASTVLK